MEGGGWRPAGQGEAMVDPGVVDWRSQLQYDARQRIVNKIMETLKRHLSVSVPEGFAELKKIAVRFEEKIYAAATNQSDYLRKISLKMLSMETKTQNATAVNPSSSNLVGSQSTADSALLGIQSQIGNQGQSLAMVNQSPARQSLAPQNVPNNAPSTSIQNSVGLAAPMSSNSGITQPAMPHIGPNSNLQNVPSMPQSSINSVAGQGATTNIYANTQRQMQGRTQPPSIVSQQHQQQSQNPLIYTQQFPQQLLKQKLTHPSLAQPHLQQQQQQQQPSLLQQNQLQSSQQSLVQMASSIPAGQSNIQQAQPTMLQTMQKSSLQNQQNSMQQSSLLHQHPQSIVRQQQSQPTLHQQSTSFQQQASSVPHQSILSSQQQQLMGQQSSLLTMQHNQLLGQQNNVTDSQQQQRLPGQQNNLLSVQQPQQMLNQQSISLQQQQLGTENNLSGQQQQQLGPQNNLPGLQQQQQAQLLGSQPGISNMQPHQRSLQMLQQNKTAIPQTQQPSLAMLQSQNQQSQHASSQQQLMPQIPSQPGQLQQQLGMQQQTGSMQREMQQRLQTSGALLQSQNAIEQQKQFIQPQRGLPEVSSSATLDSTVPTNNIGVVDWQEETYQKIKSLKELYYVELQELNQKIALKFQQHESLLSAPKQSEQFEKLKNYKMMLERTLAFFQIAKANIQLGLKEKLPLYEKQILSFLASSRGQKNVPSHSSSQLQFQHSSGQPHGGHSQSTLQRSCQVSSIQQNDNMNQVQQMNLQGSATAMQPSASANMPHGSLPLSTATQPSIMNPLQSTPNIDAMQGSSYGSLQQASINSAQQSIGASPQNTMSVTQQNNMHTLPQNSNTLQPNINSMQPTTNILQQQHLKQQQEQQQQQQLMQNQQMKQQLQHRHIQQQIMQQQQKQQILQQQPAMQQQLLQQQKQQQAAQLPVNQMAQHHINEEMKLRQGAGIKSGLYQQHFQAGQRLNYHHQQQKVGSSLPSSSPQNIQTSSPQISQHPSPQIDQHSLLSSLPKTGTPVQATNSPFVPSPSTPIAPSPVPVDSEKAYSGIALPTSAVSSGSQQTILNPLQSSIAVGTPGISASPLLAEFVSPDSHQPNGPVFSGKRGVTEKPLERLIKVIQSVPPEVLSSSVSDIGSVINMTDRIAGSAPGNGSRAAVGEDLVAMTKCRLQARNFMSQDGSAITKKMKRHISAMPLNVVPSDGRVENTFRQSDSLDICELESTAAYSIKRQKTEVNHALLEEIREINKKLIDTVVSVSDEDVDSVSVAAVGSGEGTVIKCSYSAVALSPSLKLHFASAQSPILPLKLLLPPSYPKCSPILLDGLPVEPSQDFEDLSTKAKLRFSTSLRGLQQPISLIEMARTWDVCTRKVMSEYAQQSGGGVFSSKYGAWENCVGA